jgi:hypothetical protein
MSNKSTATGRRGITQASPQLGCRLLVGANAESLEVDIPTLYDHMEAYLQRPDVLEQLKSSSEPLNPFIGFVAMIGLAITKVAELPPSPGYEPLLIRYGVDPVVARGLARIAIRRGRRRAAESGWRRYVFDALRFLAEPRQRGAILRRAQLLLQAWDKTSIIETVFDEIGLSETEFIGLLKALVEGRVVDCRRITEIAAQLAPHSSPGRGPKIREASAAHEFFLAAIERITGAHAYTWNAVEGNFTDPATKATRMEFNEADFDPRPAHRRRKAGRGVEFD